LVEQKGIKVPDITQATPSDKTEKVWPLPTIEKSVASTGRKAFKASRGDRWHAGIDIIAPVGTKVVATEDGKVVNYFRFTKPPKYNTTYCLIIQHNSGHVANYGEIQKAYVKIGAEVKAGQEIAEIGQVGLKGSSMLHFELYKKGTKVSHRWYKAKSQPAPLINPENYLKECIKK
jgi:murein DD-endopeptidase MepM/ murein hydrolase activator NlpD